MKKPLPRQRGKFSERKIFLLKKISERKIFLLKKYSERKIFLPEITSERKIWINKPQKNPPRTYLHTEDFYFT